MIEVDGFTAFAILVRALGYGAGLLAIGSGLFLLEAGLFIRALCRRSGATLRPCCAA